MTYLGEVTVKNLIGQTFESVKEKDGEEVLFTRADGTGFRMYHAQSCCESVSIAEIVGDLSDLAGTPILSAEESSSEDEPEHKATDCGDYECESHTWTFYRFATAKGPVVIRWHGSSYGYYGETVDIEEIAGGNDDTEGNEQHYTNCRINY